MITPRVNALHTDSVHSFLCTFHTPTVDVARISVCLNFLSTVHEVTFLSGSDGGWERRLSCLTEGNCLDFHCLVILRWSSR